MYKMDYAGIEHLLEIGNRATQYAWDHYEEHTSRKSVYTLYGPYSYGIGAGIPGSSTPKKERALTKQTRRRNYLIYELDEEYKLLRTVMMRDFSKKECVYHCFEFEGFQCAYPFRSGRKEPFNNEVIAFRYEEGKPVFVGFLRETNLFIKFLEFISPEKVLATIYQYTPKAKYTVHGYPVDRNAPIGALNSPVECGYREEEFHYTDFSSFFE